MKTERQKLVLMYLRMFPIWLSPTLIGERALGLNYDCASAKASPVCRQLVKQGLVERNKKGHYRIRIEGV